MHLGSSGGRGGTRCDSDAPRDQVRRRLTRATTKGDQLRHTARPLADSSRPRSAGASALNKVRGGPGRRVIPGRGDGRTHTERRESITVAQIPHEGAHGGHRAGAVKETSDRSKGRKRLDIDAAAQLLETGVSGARGVACTWTGARARHCCTSQPFASAKASMQTRSIRIRTRTRVLGRFHTERKLQQVRGGDGARF